MASPQSKSVLTTEFPADARKGCMFSVKVILSKIPGTVTVVYIPDTAQGIGLKPDHDIWIAMGEDPGPEAIFSEPVITADKFTVGGQAYAWEAQYRIIEDGTGRTLHIRGSAGGEVVQIQTW